MFVWIVILVLLAVCVMGFLREPRRLRIGILLLSTFALLGLAILGAALNRLDDPYNETAAWLLLGIIAVGLVSLMTLAGFLIYNGLIMASKKSRSVANRLSLLVGIALLAYIALGFFAIFRSRADLATWMILSVPPIAYVGFVFTSFLMYAWIYSRLAPRTSGPVDAVIVLGAGLIRNRVTPLLASRLSTGHDVYRRALARSPEASIVVSGGQGRDEAVPEAVAMSGWLEERGVQEDHIIVEPRSRTTEENLRYSEDMLRRCGKVGPVAVVTSNYHAFRAATLMRNVGLDGYTVGAPTAGNFGRRP